MRQALLTKLSPYTPCSISVELVSPCRVGTQSPGKGSQGVGGALPAPALFLGTGYHWTPFELARRGWRLALGISPWLRPGQVCLDNSLPADRLCGKGTSQGREGTFLGSRHAHPSGSVPEGEFYRYPQYEPDKHSS